MSSKFLDVHVSAMRPAVAVADGRHCAGLQFCEDGGCNDTVAVVCESEDEASAAAEVIGRAILVAYDKWMANAFDIEGRPLVICLDANEILREVRAPSVTVEVKGTTDMQAAALESRGIPDGVRVDV